MTVIMFWNTNKKSVEDDIGSICREHNVDLVILAESTISSAVLLRKMNAQGEFRFQDFTRQNRFIRFFSRLPTDSVKVIFDGSRSSTVHLVPPIGKKLLVTGVHLTSKLHAQEADQRVQVEVLNSHIVKMEQQVDHTNSVIIGDMNMNPFETPMVASDGFHAVMSKDVARKGGRTVQERRTSFFYNPMWSLMGDDSRGPPGTYYRRASGVVSYFWHMFDQVLIRPSLLDIYKPSNLNILTSSGVRDLLKGSMIDYSISDHLPLVLKL